MQTYLLIFNMFIQYIVALSICDGPLPSILFKFKYNISKQSITRD